MAATEEDVADAIRRATGGQPTGSEPGSRPSRAFNSNQFARFLYSPNVLDQLEAVRLRQITGPYAQGRLLYNLAQREVRAPRGTSYIDYARPSELAAMRRAESAAQMDVLADLDAQLKVDREKLRGQVKAEEARKKIDSAQRRIVRNFRPVAGPAYLAAGNQLVAIYSDLWIQQRELRKRRSRILAVGRRGAAATRPIQPTAVPGRTGAAATRGSSAAARARDSAAGAAARSPKSVKSGSAGSGLAKSAASAQSRAATAATAGKAGKRVGQSSVARSGQRQGQMQRTVQRTPFRSLFEFLTRPIFPTVAPRSLVRSPPRQVARQVASSSTTQLTPTAQGLTALNSAGVGSPRCRCPEPKRKKQGEKRCTNPVISKSIKDNVLTTKRELKCPPSKPK